MLRQLMPFFFRITGQEIDTLTVSNQNWLLTVDITTKDNLKFRMLQTFGDRSGESPDEQLYLWSREENAFVRVRTAASSVGHVFDKLSKTLGKDSLIF